MFVIHMSSVGQRNRSHDYENNNIKSRQKSKMDQKGARTAYQINFFCRKKEGVPVIFETVLLFTKVCLISVNSKQI